MLNLIIEETHNFKIKLFTYQNGQSNVAVYVTITSVRKLKIIYYLWACKLILHFYRQSGNTYQNFTFIPFTQQLTVR